jgi:hypothetical protein
MRSCGSTAALSESLKRSWAAPVKPCLSRIAWLMAESSSPLGERYTKCCTTSASTTRIDFWTEVGSNHTRTSASAERVTRSRSAAGERLPSTTTSFESLIVSREIAFGSYKYPHCQMVHASPKSSKRRGANPDHVRFDRAHACLRRRHPDHQPSRARPSTRRCPRRPRLGFHLSRARASRDCSAARNQPSRCPRMTREAGSRRAVGDTRQCCGPRLQETERYDAVVVERSRARGQTSAGLADRANVGGCADDRFGRRADDIEHKASDDEHVRVGAGGAVQRPGALLLNLEHSKKNTETGTTTPLSSIDLITSVRDLNMQGIN